MAKDMKEGMTCECGSCMGPMCGTISGLLVLLAGLVLAFAFGGMSADLISGILLALYGLSVLVHANGWCPMCKGK